MDKKVLAFGHRGAKGYVTENTLQSIKKALSLGVDGIEIDVHACKSGELVVFHDYTLDRLTNGKNEISNYTLDELKQLKVENKFTIPALEEVLNCIDKKCIVNIELKGKNTAKKAVKSIEYYVENHHWLYTSFIVSSFQQEELKTVYNCNKIFR